MTKMSTCSLALQNLIWCLLLVGCYCGDPAGLCKANDESCGENECPDIGDCKNGIKVEQGTTCGCCDMCIKYYKKDDMCPNVITRIPDKMCGPGLECSDKNICVQATTDCSGAQQKFDAAYESGEVGSRTSRPVCDPENGEFAALHCVPGSLCFCQGKDGSRIFGDSLAGTKNVTCACSRHSADVDDLLGTAAPRPHCLFNGNFDELQCIDERCFCANNDTVEGSFVSKHDIKKLICYNKTIHTEEYKKKCEDERDEKLTQIEELSDIDVTLLGLDVPTCTPDGNYYKVQYKGNRAFCSDPKGLQIEDFTMGRYTDAAKNMNCNCAVARYWMREGVQPLPSCHVDGSFIPYQYSGATCYCVDENGEQVCKDYDIQDVNCREVCTRKHIKDCAFVYS